MPTDTPALANALRALIQAEQGDALTPAQVEEAVEGALQLRGYADAVNAIQLDNGEMPFNATLPFGEDSDDA